MFGGNAYWVLAAVVIFNVCGQVLFKVAANNLKQGQTPFDTVIALAAMPSMWAAVAIYGAMILVWVWVLKIMPLSIAYSAVSAVFVLVPIAATILFGENLSKQFLIGTVLIASGIWLIHAQ